MERDYVTLYREAFARYRAHALWNVRRIDNPTKDEAVVVAKYLRKRGDLAARSLAERMEAACAVDEVHAAQ
jgi:hypothetical protein